MDAVRLGRGVKALGLAGAMAIWVSAPMLTARASVAASELPDAPSATLQAAAATAVGAPPLVLQSSSSGQTQTSAGQTQSSAGQTQTPPGEPSLGDLGLTPEQTKGDPGRQALLDRRTHMLKVHQRLGLITVIPVAAACISAIGAPPGHHGNNGNTATRDLHVAIGGVAVAMYGATAYYAIRAPRVSNEPARGGIKLHKYLIYLHAPGMILTPILGAIAYNQVNSGQKVHGIAAAHGAVAVITAASYGAAIVAVSWPIHF